MPTIKDVAKVANVSVATVSRALNKPETVKRETKELVEKAAASLNYQPNSLGRHLRMQKTFVVLVMLSSIANNFFVKVVRGIEDEARNLGYKIMLCAMRDNSEIEKGYIDLLKNKFADGIIFMNTVQTAGELSALAKEFAVIQCSEYFEKARAPYVTIDNEKAAYDAVSHLISLKRKKIAHITVNNQMISTEQRLGGFRRAMAENGLETQEEYVVFGNYGYRSAYAAMKTLLSLSNRPDSVFAISDRMAAGAIKCAVDMGYRVPEDIAVVGFDNTDMSDIYIPSITTVSQSQHTMGATAMKLLVSKINGEATPKKTILGHELIVRQSTAGNRG